MKIEGQSAAAPLAGPSTKPVDGGSLPKHPAIETATTPKKETEPIPSVLQKPVSQETMESTVKGLNEAIKITNSHVQFTLHKGTKEYYVKIINDSTGEVIKEIPSKEFLDRVAKMLELSGLIVDAKR